MIPMSDVEIREILLQKLKAPRSADILADAWQIVDMMRMRSWSVTVNACGVGNRDHDWEDEWHACFASEDGEEMYHGFGDTPARALYVAAAKALDGGGKRGWKVSN